MPSFDKVTVFLAELIGTALLLFFGCAGCIVWGGGVANHLQIVINFGLAVMAAVQIFGCISGAHLNPAVTIAAYISKQVDLTTAAIYFVAQLIGSFMGFGLLKILTPESIFSSALANVGSNTSSVAAAAAAPGLCTTLPHDSLAPWQAVAIEFVATAVLILTCCACAWDKRNANHHDSLPLRFGLTVTGLACAVGPYTGGSLNPVRSLAPALWHGSLHLQWIYWVGPMAAGVVTAVLYRLVFLRESPDEQRDVDHREEYTLTTVKET